MYNYDEYNAGINTVSISQAVDLARCQHPNTIFTEHHTTTSHGDIHTTSTHLCLTHDSQNEAAVHYLDGYMTVIRLHDWSRAFYRICYINSDNILLTRYENPADV